MTELLRAVQLFRAEWPAARAAWADVDPRLYAVTPELPVERIMEITTSPFGALARAIGHQQVSIHAGRAIVGRLVAACGGDMDPVAALRLTDEQLRAVGLSRQKIVYVRAIAQAAVSGFLDDLERLPDQAVIERLVQLPGIGVWSARMFALFHLERPDIFSGDDLGLREGIRILDGLAEQPTPRVAEARAEVWGPFRSIAAVTLWDLVRRTRAGAVV
jgi:DNA-3-methyladenine glycosylase II